MRKLVYSYEEHTEIRKVWDTAEVLGLSRQVYRECVSVGNKLYYYDDLGAITRVIDTTNKNPPVGPRK